MFQPLTASRIIQGCRALAACLTLALASCQTTEPAPKPIIRYTNLGPKQVPAFLKGSIYENVEVENNEPMVLAGYGLVGRLRGSGDTTAAAPVRQAMITEMVKHGWGSRLLPGYAKYQPEDILRDPNYAIVRVDGMLPPGARKGQRFDVAVSSLPGNRTSSLSRGVLFETELRRLHDRGPELGGPGVLARAGGPILVNPAYALDVTFDKDGNLVPKTPTARASLRNGLVMFFGGVLEDRPILLRLRQPQRSMSRSIEYRINERYQFALDRKKANDLPGQAEAIDEGIVELYVPKALEGNWEHFIGVATHIFLNNNPAFAAAKSKELAQEAIKPNSPLMDISYCWEGLGAPALEHVLPLLANPSPDVAFAAARAAVFIGDPSGAALDTLVRIASEKNNPFQVSAVKALGELPKSSMVNRSLRELLDSDQVQVRIEAYKVLSHHEDSSVYTRWVPKQGEQEKFALDLVPSKGPPLIYASRRGKPRIAIIGRTPALTSPVTFLTMNDKLMIASEEKGRNVTIFFRDNWLPEPVKMASRPDVPELIVRLAGEGGREEQKLDFTYGEILAILQNLTEKQCVFGYGLDGRAQPTAFVLQESPRNETEIFTAPPIPEGRPQSENAVGMAMPSGASDAPPSLQR